MATRLRTALIVVVVVLAAYTGAAWLIGTTVQGRLAHYEQQMLASTPYIVQVRRVYHKGIFGATEEATYRLGGPFGRLSQALSAGGAGSPLELTVRNTIHHGPLPQLRSAALATVDTELVPPPALGSKLNAIFAGRPALTIHASLGWLGGRSTTFSMPAFRAQLPSGATLVSRGFSGSVEATRNAASRVAQVASGGFGIQGPKASVDFGDIRFDASLRRVFDAIYVGDINIALASVSARGASGAPFLLKGVSIGSASQADSEYVNYQTRFTSDEMTAGGLAFSHVVYGLRILHLEGRSLAALSRALQQARAGVAAGGTAGGAAAAQSAIRNALSQYGVELLLHDPVIQIQSLAFAMPEGEFHLAASLAAHGIRREDLGGGPAAMMALVRYLDAAVDLRVDDALLSKLISSSSRGPALSAQLDSLEKQGYLRRDGKAWTAQLVLRGGRLTINGQPYPPTARF